MKHFLSIIVSLMLLVGLNACSVNQRKFLVIDTSMVRVGQSQDDVQTILGQPDAKRRTGPDSEAWYYYNPRKRFYQRISIVGSKLGKIEIEVLEIKFLDNQVKKATFYVSHEKK